jgi:hypothetical protein
MYQSSVTASSIKEKNDITIDISAVPQALASSPRK